MLILLIAFGAMVAAGIPLLLAITGVIGTMGLIGPLSQITPVDESVNHVILLIGLAVGVDYSLFYLRRVREERAAGRSNQAAIEAAAATSGRAVLISGITVMIAMAGMYFGGASTFTSFATGTIAVVAVAMLGSLTVLPAMLSLTGDRVDKGRIPGLDRLKARMASFGLWSRVVDRVMRRPLLWAVTSVALLLALAAPALHMQTGTPAMDTLPQELTVVQKFNHLKAAFPSETSSLSVVIKGKDVTAPAVTEAIKDLEQATHQHKALFPSEGPLDQDINPDKTVNTLTMEVAGDGTDETSSQALDTLRDDLVPATLGKVGGLEAYSTGGTAVDRDFNDSMISHLPFVFAFVILAAFLLLLFTFRSIVIPIKAIVLNLLSIGAAYGAMVLVFQHGWFNNLLGISSTGPIESWIPLFMFVVLFGLSMDYHVFILTRVRELYDRGMKTEDAVASAIKSTAGVVTSAAVVMVFVFAIFGTLSWMMFKQMGLGLAFAILLDATLIRGVLLPASMKLLGEQELVAAEEARLAARDQARGRGGARERVGITPTPVKPTGARPPRRAPVVPGAQARAPRSGSGSGIDPDEPGRRSSRLRSCPISSFTTPTGRPNARPPTPPGAASRARSATIPRPRPAWPAATRSGGASRPLTATRRSRCCRATSPSARSSRRSGR